MIHRMNRRIHIIDYGMGNLKSIINSLNYLGYENITVDDSETNIQKSDFLILPGVGAFATAMNSVNKLGLDRTIKEFIQTKKPFMGICLGLQLLFTHSDEFADTSGLGIIEGNVRKIPEHIGKVPQINWNSIEINQEENKILKDIKEKENMYFVHSFYVEPKNEKHVLTYTNYGDLKYCSSISFENVFAFQFHPEKSAKEGLKIYSNFKEIIELGV